MMEVYVNQDGDSNVAMYSIEPDAITIRFKDGSQYVYTYASPGRNAVETMKELARRGHGLNTYIDANVRYLFERKVA